MASEREAMLRRALARRVLVLDSAMGTAIQDRHLGPDDFGGEAYEGCNEYLVLTKPEVIATIHEENLKAGCDILETNTFGSTELVLNEFDLGPKAQEITIAAARMARDLADTYSTPDQPRFVAGAVGPTTKAISVTGGITFKELVRQFRDQIDALVEGGADYILMETCQDTRNIKAGLLAADQVRRERGVEIPVAISGTIETMGTMLAGQTIDALYASVSHRNLLYMGMNCSTGPEYMTDHLRTLSEWSRFPVSCVPNAGLPDEEGRYLETPHMMGQVLARFGKHGWLNVIGGCCGTRPDHITHFASLAGGMEPRALAERKPVTIVSGIDFLEISEETRPLTVGERTNVIGSRKFKRLIAGEKFEEASDIARAQVKSGAHIIDVCVANPDRDEMADMERFLAEVIKKVKAPLMIDSTDAAVIEQALTYCQGKAIINSINLEDGLERFEQVVPIAQRFGAALVVGTIDDDPQHGMGVTRQRKVEIAERSFKILTEDFGVDPTDIIWDPLVFPIATGDENYIGSTEETIEGVRLLKENFPGTRTILGISNVSFGLPPAGREVLNTVFLHHCVQAGLDLAIVNAEKLVRYASLEPEEVTLADDLLFNRGDDPVAAFTARYRDAKPKPKVDKAKLPLDERLRQYIIEGSKDGLTADLDLKMAEVPPLEIINGPLMNGMDEVGRLFNDNQLIVAEVLQSAEVMKAAVAHLEPHMEKADDAGRGTVILATVKGDVHDIGKNLVDIILSNNGFKVVNLGIKIPPDTLIQACREHTPDIIGLSGLLVKSTRQMLATAEDLREAGIDTPMLCGGAALSEKFVMTRIDEAYGGRAIYAKDAMEGLALAKRVVDPEQFQALGAELDTRREERFGEGVAAPAPKKVFAVSSERSGTVPVIDQPPEPPDYARHLLRNTPLEHIWAFVDWGIFYRIHLGMKGDMAKKLLAAKDDPAALRDLVKEEPKAAQQWDLTREVMAEYRDRPELRPGAIYQFYRAASEGNKLHVYATPEDASAAGPGTPAVSFDFPRQGRPDGRCLSDYVNPLGAAPDNICMFVTTVGEGMREEVDRLKAAGQYLKSHILQSMAVRTAEAYAEYLHKQVRRFWGMDDGDLSLADIFRAKYEGQRFSFGYPACPVLDDQALMWRVLKPEEIGCTLTDEMMMEPEASVSALVFHHPRANYFNADITAHDVN